MLTLLRLFLPVLIPSWRFFSSIAPSPRIEYALCAVPGDRAEAWQEFRPRPPRLSPAAILGRLIWNPVWNETLYLVTCAERLIEQADSDDPAAVPAEGRAGDHSLREILGRVAAGIGPADRPGQGFLQVRLVLVRREGAAILREIRLVSPVVPRPAPAAR